jgi:hypothetical protein
MWNWLANNAAPLGIVIASAPIIWGIVQFVLIKRADAKRVRFETFHRLIKELVEPEGDGRHLKMDRQIATIFELRRFPHYFPVTRRILKGLKTAWRDWNPRLLEEIDLTIDYIERAMSTRYSLAIWNRIREFFRRV